MQQRSESILCRWWVGRSRCSGSGWRTICGCEPILMGDAWMSDCIAANVGTAREGGLGQRRGRMRFILIQPPSQQQFYPQVQTHRRAAKSSTMHQPHVTIPAQTLSYARKYGPGRLTPASGCAPQRPGWLPTLSERPPPPSGTNPPEPRCLQLGPHVPAPPQP
eukprot:359416-Chlamydomonas_euryale.AAC.2